MKLLHSEGLIYAPLKLVYGNQIVRATCLVDTGSAGTAVDLSLVDLDPPPGFISAMVGIGGKQEVLTQLVESVTLDGSTTREFPIQFGDYTSNFGTEGFIRGDLLKALGVKIDYFSDTLSCQS